jgi:hypothetical protein
MKRFETTFLLIILLLAALAAPQSAHGQRSGQITWSGETILRQIPSERFRLYFPKILADRYGVVHVFWMEGYSLYYLQRDASGWTNPIDVVYSRIEIGFYAAAIDQDNRLHLVWTAPGGIYHKSVPVHQAKFVRKWSPARTIGLVGRLGTPLRIAVDPQNNLHIVFADWDGREGRTVAGNVYHFQSADGGETWSNFKQISNVPGSDVSTDPRMAFDDQGRIHFVWGQMIPYQLGSPARGVYYARLDNASGELVSSVVAEKEPDFRWTTAINLGVIDSQNLVAIWTCGVNAGRCASRSFDGGEEWTPYTRIFGELIGLSGWDAIFSDGDGQVYWMGVLRYPQAMYYSFWDGEQWLDPPLPASQDAHMRLGENVDVAVGLGNEVHVVSQFNDQIVYMSGVTGARRLDPLPVPTEEASAAAATSPEVTPTPEHPQSATPTPNPAIANLSGSPVVDSSANMRVISLSILAVLGTLGVVFAVTRLIQRWI